MCALLNINCNAIDLDSFLKGFLDQDHINKINGFLSAQNINYQF